MLLNKSKSEIEKNNNPKTNSASDFISDALNVCLFAKTEAQITQVWLFNRIFQAWCVVTTLHRSHVWPALMVSCHPVETAAAVAATLTGPLLSNWWIILLLIWPPKAGNAKASSLFVEARTVLLYPFRKKIQLLFTEEHVQSPLSTIYRSPCLHPLP